MFIKTAHILIEQGLQNIGVFAYGDMLPEEIDLQLNKKMLGLMEDAFDPLKRSRHPFQDGQSILDKFQNLQVKNTNLTCTLEDDHYKASLPDDYVHLVTDASQVLRIDNMTPVTSGNIVNGNFYYVAGQKSIIYNGNTYETGSYFQGGSLIGYTSSGSGTILLIQLRSNRRSNRLQYEEFIDEVLDNYLTRTKYSSPVSSISGGYLWVYHDGKFMINNLWVTYVRKPKTANYNFTTYSTTTNLTVGSSYESVDNAIVYNGQTYQPFQPFTVVTGHLTYSGSATVRLQGDGDIEFSDTMAYDVIDEVIKEISIITEQSQQKVNNLFQKGE